MLFILPASLGAIALIASPIKAAVAPGEINCRYSAISSANVNYYTCTELAEWYYITVEDFFKLNPTIDKACSNIKPNTEYCVEGYSCLPGTCYSGACLGFPSEYSMDGNCGKQNKGLRCGGKWGSCCSVAGKCGTGEAFCGVNQCQSGNCTMIIPDWSGTTTSIPVAVPTPSAGSISPDGSCGLVYTYHPVDTLANCISGVNKFICKGSTFGDCCSSSGFCGTTTAHCSAGCQTTFGTCTSTDLSPDGTCTCGGTSKFQCKGSAFGDCCSSSGYCGSTTGHCTAGCQAGFGTCTASDMSPDGTCGA
ncbi:hypothetical protein DE146DRAFT_607491 [Phaeosphaeria sp. MPI-PUGE-AT-0046c]|nr:hypothetical protein DE146DRAFT_607491 [Phaeosphaeria sp. MPI-PUGE-AT-0046c]